MLIAVALNDRLRRKEKTNVWNSFDKSSEWQLCGCQFGSVANWMARKTDCGLLFGCPNWSNDFFFRLPYFWIEPSTDFSNYLDQVKRFVWQCTAILWLSEVVCNEMHTHRRTKNAATLAASLMFTSRAHVHTHITTQAQVSNIIIWSYRYFEAGWLLMFPIPLPISFTLVSPKPPTRSIPWMAKKVCVENWWLTIWKEATI